MNVEQHVMILTKPDGSRHRIALNPPMVVLCDAMAAITDKMGLRSLTQAERVECEVELKRLEFEFGEEMGRTGQFEKPDASPIYRN